MSNFQRPEPAFILSLVGGVFTLVGSAVVMMWAFNDTPVRGGAMGNMMGNYGGMMSGMMGGHGLLRDQFLRRDGPPRHRSGNRDLGRSDVAIQPA